MDEVETQYTQLLAAIRARKTLCKDCARRIQESVTGVKRRRNEAGGSELVCDACFYYELGENLPQDMPRLAISAPGV